MTVAKAVSGCCRDRSGFWCDRLVYHQAVQIYFLH